jgi:hypothetical protein
MITLWVASWGVRHVTDMSERWWCFPYLVTVTFVAAVETVLEIIIFK